MRVVTFAHTREADTGDFVLVDQDHNEILRTKSLIDVLRKRSALITQGARAMHFEEQPREWRLQQLDKLPAY